MPEVAASKDRADAANNADEIAIDDDEEDD